MKVIVFTISALLLLNLFSLAEEQPVILLAYEETRFKADLISEMTILLEREGYAIETLDHSGGALENIDKGKYAAIFITNSGVNSQVRPWVTKWLEGISGEARVLLHTTQRFNWNVDANVDVVTSASQRRNVKNIADEYAGKLIEIIKR